VQAIGEESDEDVRFPAAGTGVDYLALVKAGRMILLCGALATARPLFSLFVCYSDETASELEFVRQAANMQQRYGRYRIGSVECLTDRELNRTARAGSR
jgi:phosphoenolpyruvate carboxylase